MKRLALICLLAAAVLAATAQARSGNELYITIRHQMQGCHTWSVDNGPWRATQSVTLHAGATIEFDNDDAMSHRLVELHGPPLAMPATMLVGTFKHPGASTVELTFVQRGTYRLRTIDGEASPAAPPTSGPDNVLRLTVHVL